MAKNNKNSKKGKEKLNNKVVDKEISNNKDKHGLIQNMPHILDFSEYKMITNIEDINNTENLGTNTTKNQKNSKFETLKIEINKYYEVEIPKNTKKYGNIILPKNTDKNTDNEKYKNKKIILEDFKDETSKYALKNINNIKSDILTNISMNLATGLKNKITGRKTIYITDNVPLMGHTAFGVIDRGTNIIQVRGHSGCNIRCPFCSVDEGTPSKSRINDYYVDIDHLMNTFEQVVNYKGNNRLEAHLDGQGEPTLYHPLPELVERLNNVVEKGNGIVSIQTNGVNLSYKLIDELEEAGLHRINMSINAMDEKFAKGMSGKKTYDIERIKEMAEYVKNSKIHLLIAPLLLPNYNDEEFRKVIDYAVELQSRVPQNTINPITDKLNPILGVQLCLTYQFGRKVPNMKLWDFKKFYEFLNNLENEYTKQGLNVHLKTPLKYYGSRPVKRIPCPFSLNETVEGVKVIAEGRIYGEVIGMARDRVIQIINCKNTEKLLGNTVNVKIHRVKDNIIVATLC
ncbi:radical SAM protein [Methanococcus voltae]|uniref:Radical SAM domain protein n=1 Tax=Methanococcus voltae (strain ATCC BAA-1334 / A3) TaxID=456320 RepID=D7DR59_METV3|nr:radical SAM protein [Methanococcus voltae]MCS3900996.1 putative Fe-S cluster-containing radical SAM superfamily enzyme [Methanococcus voltae]